MRNKDLPVSQSTPPAPPSLDLLGGLLAATPRKPRTTPYQRGMRVFALFAALLAGVALWVAGAYFTLAWLGTTRAAPHIAAYGLWAYLLPAAITAVELALNPRREKTPLLLLLWLAVLLIDTVTTAVGVQATAGIDSSTFAVPLFGVCGLIGIAAGVALAYAPEKLVSVSIATLWDELGR